MNKERFYDPFKMLNKVVINDDKKICPNCKSRNERGAQFCAHCGFNFVERFIPSDGDVCPPTRDLRENYGGAGNNTRNAYILISNGVKKQIDKSPFTIGKDRNNTSLCLESKVISRIHAKIVREGEKYYLIDNNSTNGTFLNGVRLSPNQKLMLQNNDIIKLANIEINFINI